MRYLGLDLGTKTCGVAISDRTNTISSPLCVLRYNDSQVLAKEVNDLINKYEISEVALGNPKNMDNSEGFASTRSKEFKNILENFTNVKITLVDERLTTVEAENILIDASKRREQRKKIIDGVAAMLILESFIKMKGNNNEE